MTAKIDTKALRALEANAAHDGWASSAWGVFRDALEANAPALLDAAEERDALRAEVATLARFIVDKNALNRHLLEQVDALRGEVERLREALQSVDKELEFSEYTEEGFLRSCVRAALRPTEGEVKP